MILLGDCLVRLKELEDNSVDSVVTDPPYGWRFMGKAWDDANIMKLAIQGKRPGETYVGVDGVTRKTRNQTAEAAGKYDLSLSANQAFQTFTENYAKELLRVLKPGGHMLIFCGPRTYHRMASGVEDAGFEIRDQLQWLFGSGFPKSHNLKDAWQGWGTALKPANEPIVLARKPLEKGLTVAANVLKWGVGGLNIDASRIGVSANDPNHRNIANKNTLGTTFGSKDEIKSVNVGSSQLGAQGRWPANLILDETAAEMLDEQVGPLLGAGNKVGTAKKSSTFFSDDQTQVNMKYDNGGGASRFFYCAKASKSERNAGLEGMPEKELRSAGGTTSSGKPSMAGHDRFGSMQSNNHPTVKPLKLMEYLIKLVTPPGGLVLDPFMGSGSTGVAAFKNQFKFIGIEMSAEYCEIARRRIEAVE